MLDETIITKAIIESYTKDLINSLKVDVIIAGAGPAGLTASKFLAEEGLKTIIFERKLSIGGGMLGGGMMFNKIVVQKGAKRILDLYNIKTEEYESNYYIADAIEAVGKLAANAIDAGVKIFNLISVEDVKIDDSYKVIGAVINWSAVEIAKLHVDPMTIESKYVVDATGHDSEVVNVVLRKIPEAKLNTPTGKKIGETLKGCCMSGDSVRNDRRWNRTGLHSRKKHHNPFYQRGSAGNLSPADCRTEYRIDLQQVRGSAAGNLKIPVRGAGHPMRNNGTPDP